MIEIPGYRITRQIGAGGMGVVFEAEQLHPKRRVALKVLRPDCCSPALRKRLDYEAQVLAYLHHPGIAQIYGAGEFESEDGPRPYFSMEYIEGEPLIAHADTRNLSIAERVELVAKVCDAVEHAHRAGIIHRDLKPDNVLVGADGQPKVLDFGLARAMTSEIKALTSCKEIGDVLGTILYMSPEQPQGRSDLIDARSDVYALGVLAFQLLTGAFPHDPTGRTLIAYIRALEEETPRPAGSLNPLLRGDLEVILTKALMREKVLRYSTAGEFAEDLRRYLRNEPITARPLTAIYNFRKFAWRQRVALAGAVATVFALGAGLVATSRQAALAENHARQADEMRIEAEWRQYIAGISLAQLAHLQHRDRDGLKALFATPERLRGWKWHHLHRQCEKALMILRGHTGGIRSLAWSPDGTRLASASNDRTARIWDTTTGKCLATLEGHTREVIFITWSPDGTRIVTSADDNTARIWSAKGEPLHILQEHSGPINRAPFSPSGDRIATASDDGTGRIWDTVTGSCVGVLSGHSDSVFDLVFSPDGKHIATASDDATARIWNTTTLRCETVLAGHKTEVNAVRFSPDGRRIATISEDGEGRVWSHREQAGAWGGREWEHPTSYVVFGPHVEPKPRWVEFVNGGDAVVVVSRLGKLSTYASDSGEQLGVNQSLAPELDALSLDPQSSTLLLACKDGDVRLARFNAFGEAPVRLESFQGHEHYVTSISLHPSGETFASGSGDTNIRIWSNENELNSVSSWTAEAEVILSRFTRQGTILVMDHHSNWTTLDTARMSVKDSGSLASRDRTAEAYSFVRDEVVSINQAGRLSFWNLPEGTARIEVMLPPGEYSQISYAGQHDRFIITAGPGPTATIVAVETGDVMHRLDCGGERTAFAVMSSDATRAFTISSDGLLRSWGVPFEGPDRALRLDDAPVCMSLAPNGARLAIVTESRDILMIDPELLALQTIRPTGMKGNWPVLAWSQCGGRFALADSEAVLKIFEGRNGRELASVPKTGRRVNDMNFSPDNTLLLMGIEGGTLLLRACPRSAFLLPRPDFGVDSYGSSPRESGGGA